MSSADQEAGVEARLNIHDVPGEISRIFFGSHEGGGRPPSYWDGGYSGGGGLADPGRPVRLVYPGYEDDIYLVIKLGQAALIIFIIFAIFSIIFLLTTCIFSITNFNGERKSNDEEDAPQPFKMQMTNPGGIYDKIRKRPSSSGSGPAPGPGARGWTPLASLDRSRSQGVTNLSLDTSHSRHVTIRDEDPATSDTSRSGSSEPEVIPVTRAGGLRSPASPPPPRPAGSVQVLSSPGASDTERARLSSSTSSSSSLSHNRSLPYYEIPAVARQLQTFSPSPSVPQPGGDGRNQRLIN